MLQFALILIFIIIGLIIAHYNKRERDKEWSDKNEFIDKIESIGDDFHVGMELYGWHYELRNSLKDQIRNYEFFDQIKQTDFTYRKDVDDYCTLTTYAKDKNNWVCELDVYRVNEGGYRLSFAKGENLQHCLINAEQRIKETQFEIFRALLKKRQDFIEKLEEIRDAYGVEYYYNKKPTAYEMWAKLLVQFQENITSERLNEVSNKLLKEYKDYFESQDL